MNKEAMNEKLAGVKRSVSTLVTPEDSDAGVRFNITLDFSDLTCNDVIDLAVKPRVITWQNKVRKGGLKKLQEMPKNVTIKVQPLGTRTATPIDPIQAILSLPPEEQKAKLAELVALMAEKAKEQQTPPPAPDNPDGIIVLNGEEAEDEETQE